MANIQIGIDLGTTNSEAAIINNGQIEIVKNHFGDEYTPSVFGINKANEEVIGKKAYNALSEGSKKEIQNNKAEIKRLMGTPDKVYFSRIDKEYSAAEISAKILERLKQDIKSKSPDIDITGIVITIPAHFSTVQAEATKKAGELAGFKYVLLLQEPIAAAISYGFTFKENGNWLVYDLGGGTFDSALISAKDNNLKVLSHSGDNFLGGKDIDWLIVEEIIAPVLIEKYNLENFSRANKNYSAVFTRLKNSAETAKIQLSRAEEVKIEVDVKIDDDEIYENITLSRSQLKSLLQNLISKTIDLCKQTILEANISKESISKIILVGGPTQLPFIKETLEEVLSIPVDTSSDPLTAIARGACIFASSQMIPQEFCKQKEINDNTYILKLNYESMTSETEEIITGIIFELIENENEFFVQIQSHNNTYNSDKIRLKNGKFIANIVIEENKTNEYWVYLFDKDGNSLDLSIDSFSITHGLSLSGAPIPHSIGVGITKKDNALGILKEESDIFFEKNSILPLERTKSYKTIKGLKKGDMVNCLPITLYEGEHSIPDRNIRICEIEINGEQLPYDLPESSDVEVTVKVNESREVSIEAYIPLMDLSFDARASYGDETLNIEVMTNDLEDETERLKDFDNLCTNDERQRLYSSINDIKQSINKSENDDDEKRKTNIRIKELKAKIDRLQNSKKFEIFKENFYNSTTDIQQLIEEIKDVPKKDEFLNRLETVKTDGNQAINQNNEILLNRVNEQLDELGRAVVMANDFVWVMWLRDFAENKTFTDEEKARYIINRGFEAYKNNEMQEVKSCVHQLSLLLPNEEKVAMDNKMAGITK